MRRKLQQSKDVKHVLRWCMQLKKLVGVKMVFNQGGK